MLRPSKILLGLATSLAVLARLSSADATVVTLTHNSTSVYQPPTRLEIATSSSIGIFSWDVGDLSQLNQRWYWYRLGDTGGESPINSLGPASISQTASNAATITYAGGNGLTIAIDYTLTGSASWDFYAAELLESISITNTSGLALHFFQYNDFDLAGTSSDVYAEWYLDNTVFQLDEQIGHFGVPNWFFYGTASANPAPSHRQAGFYPELLNKLSDQNPTTLNDLPGTGPNSKIGPGDISWAFQWDVSTESFVIDARANVAQSRPLGPYQKPGDVNGNYIYDEEDVRGFAFALTDPTGIFFLESGGAVGDLIAIYNFIDRSGGVIDFDDLAAFADLIAPSFGSVGAAHAAIDGAIANQVPEPAAWLICLGITPFLFCRALRFAKE